MKGLDSRVGLGTGPDKVGPSRPAAKLEAVCDLMKPAPIYCECKPDCDHIVGYGPPLISKEEALKILEIKP